ncbi:Glycoside hydrolase, family 18, catalytic domain protein [Kalmanozyma brasiliensis GHG001]|uniref:chitinase n=1 Tax=Kalmanozyma brasiliensis (strain GHG001) TaxID=1365824 RepID=V5GSQ2_KALBG|nr:Glycoside hydrolase, family 18, catalytic domain protein [Kalmanozyma brasiliensis GHG001]EST08952.1 Glycoside hydrolase, family 18, catalytic domain protein [Kalmanozyma brasiliensis GHG001]
MFKGLKHKMSKRFDEEPKKSPSLPPSPTKPAAYAAADTTQPQTPAATVPTTTAPAASAPSTSAGTTPAASTPSTAPTTPPTTADPSTTITDSEGHEFTTNGAIVPRINLGYFTNWGIYGRKYSPLDVPVCDLTHVLYAFADVNPNTGECILTDLWADEQLHYTGDSWNDSGNNLYGNFKQFLLLKKKNRALKLMLSVGGWTFGPHFAPMASDRNKRAKFVSSAITILENDGLDGIDIDWEYPDNDAQAANYVSLLKELRAGLTAHQQKKKDANPYLLSIAAPCGPDHYQKLRAKDMDQYLDFWNLMAYDFAGSWSTVTGHQANLWSIKGQPPSADNAINWYIAQGVVSHKLVLGIPLYGRGFENTDGPQKPYNGTGQGTWEAGNWDYKFLPVKGAKEMINTKIAASWSYDAKKREFISYDTPQNVLLKCQYIVNKRLRGAMFWELSGDATKAQGGADRSIVTICAKNMGVLDSTLNHISYPYSKWDNVRNGMK